MDIFWNNTIIIIILTIFVSSKNANQGHKLELTHLYACWIIHTRHHFRMLKLARNAFNIGEVWNPVCCHGNKTFKLILCCTFSRTLLQRIKQFCYKLAEKSFFIIFDQNLVVMSI